MAKQLNVNLAFNADTGKAKAQIQELQMTLSKISAMGTSNIGTSISDDLKKASAAAQELQVHLNNAFNATTGKFDLSMLDRSLAASNTNIQTLAGNLLKVGPTGRQAFMELAQSISMADQPMLRISNRLREFGNTLKNTVRWQLSSSMLHGFMGAIQSAYGYAQDLNKSLTDIRIVTGASTDEMARFAEQANKTAKALSTTTTDYTNASLIYFQQGLSDAEVKARTDVTIKMANASGQSAQIVSDQMTAIWNNFDDGSESLEYYADVIAALGAATASSSEEIAAGLEKFAAVAETAGLSYEYATAALATVTAETRQSADVVGTAFKTLFARIQGLKQGETLDDGTDLNKYSEALYKVGIDIKNTNGDIKDMDQILDELGSKWQSLGKDQQLALAQTVAGVRQYTQLVALMDNWDVFQTNLGIAQGAEGTLEEQAKIYAQSWEAAQKRVQTAAQGIYDSILDDQFFIKLNNGFANILTGIEAFIDGLGGVKPLLIGIGSIFMTTFANKIPQILQDFSYNIKLMTKGTAAAYQEIQKQMNDITTAAIEKKQIDPSTSLGKATVMANQLTGARSKLALVSDKMTASEKQMAEASLQNIERQRQETIEIQKKAEAIQDSISAMTATKKYGDGTSLDDAIDAKAMARSAATQNTLTGGDIRINGIFDSSEAVQKALSNLDGVATQVAGNINDKLMQALGDPRLREKGADLGNSFAPLQEILRTGFDWKSITDGEIPLEEVKASVKALIELIPEGARQVLGLDTALEEMGKATDVDTLRNKVEAMADGLDNATIQGQDLIKALRGIGHSGDELEKLRQKIQEYTQQTEKAKNSQNMFNNMVNQFKPTHTVRMSEAMGALAGMMGNVVTIGRSISSMFQSWQNPDLSAWEKVSTTFMSLSMIIPSVTSMLSGYATIVAGLNQKYLQKVALETASIVAKTTEVALIDKETTSLTANLAAEASELAIKMAANNESKETIAAAVAELLSQKGINAEKAKGIGVRVAETAVKQVETVSTWALVKALLAEAAAWLAAHWYIVLAVAALGAAVAIISKLVVTQKEAQNAINESTEAYNEQKSAVEQLSNELESIQQKIKELEEGGISLVEQEEIDKLREQEASLERQLAIEKELLAIASQKQADDFDRNYKRASSWTGDIPDNMPDDFTFEVEVPVEDPVDPSPNHGNVDIVPDNENTDNVYTPPPGKPGYGMVGIQATYEDTGDASANSTEATYGTVDIQPTTSTTTTKTVTMSPDEYYKNVIEPLYNQQKAYEEGVEGAKALTEEELKLIKDYEAAMEESAEESRQWYSENYDKIKEYEDGFYAWLDETKDDERVTDEMRTERVQPIVDATKALYGSEYEEKVYGAANVENAFEDTGIDYEKIILENKSDPAKAGEIIAGQFSEGFKHFLYSQGIIPEDYAEWLAEEGTRMIQGIEGKLEGTNMSIDSLRKAGLKEEDIKYLAEIESFQGLDEAAVLRIIEEQKAKDMDYDSQYEKMAEENGFEVEDFKAYRDYLAETNKELAEQPELLNKVALAQMRAQRGTKTMQDSLTNWSKAIRNGDKNIEEYTKTINEMQEAYKDVFNTIDPAIIENLSQEFLTSEKTMNLMARALAGDEQAWNDWEAAVLTEINNTHSAFAGMSDGMIAEMNSLTTAAANLDFSGLQPGADIQDAAFLAKLANMSFATEEAAQVMSDNLSSVGVDAEIKEHTVTVPANSTVTEQNGAFVVTPPGGEPFTVPISAGITQSDQEKTYTYYTLEGAKYNGRGVRPSTGPSNNGGGGGGGSKKKPEKKSSTDRTRYHTLENQLEDLTDAYDKVSAAADRAFGKDKLKLIDEEIAATDDLIDKQEEYIDAISKDLPKDKAIMTGYYDQIIGGPEMQFDEDGNISNYDDIEAAMHAKYNEMAGKYTSDSEEWQEFEKQYEKVEQYIKQYEETYDLLREEEGNYQELLNQRADLELTKIQYKAELSLNIEDDEIAVIEHQLDMLGDNAFKAAEAIELQIEKAEAVYDKIQVNQSALNDILGQQLSQKEIELFYSGDMSVLEGKSFTDNQVQAIKDYRDSLLDLNADMMDIRDNIQEQVMETFDAWNEKLEQGMSTLEHYGSVLESYSNIIDVVGKDALGLSDAFMTDLGEAQVSNAIDQVNAARDAYESMINAQTEAEAALAQARANGDEESIKYWEDTLQSITENAQSAQEELLGSWEEALSAISAQFEDAVQMVVDTFNDSVYALGGLEGLSEEFSRQLENSDVMLDDYHKIYELSKLTRDINNKLDDTKIIAGKQKLKDLLEEINEYQQEGVEMSQYDLEYLQAEYNLRLAEIELEEAQRAKSTVRMSRDNEGNWSYVYTQNTDAVDSAQQKYEDALYAMQDLSSNYIDEMSEQLISTSQEMQEALAAIRIQDYASIDEYYAEVERVQKQYQDQLAMQEAELNKAVENNKTLYDEDWTNYHNATGYKISDTKDFATTFKDTLLGTIMGSEEDTSNFTSIIGSAVQTMSDGLMQAAQTYYTNLEAAMQAAGTSTDNFAEDTEANIDAVVAKSKEGAAAVDQMAKEMDEAFSAITDKVSAWQETYGLAMQSIIDSNLAVVESFNAMLEAMSIDAGQITVNYDINTTPDGVDPAAFDTGGYTGEWGDAGKLAVLHEKEMILNQGDTEKFLKAMAYSKMILETIELNAKQASLGMGQIMPTVVQEEAPQTLEQMVHITAEFPGVNDHYEIEEAFNNLINKASQYANRKL